MEVCKYFFPPDELQLSFLTEVVGEAGGLSPEKNGPFVDDLHDDHAVVSRSFILVL